MTIERTSDYHAHMTGHAQVAFGLSETEDRHAIASAIFAYHETVGRIGLIKSWIMAPARHVQRCVAEAGVSVVVDSLSIVHDLNSVIHEKTKSGSGSRWATRCVRFGHSLAKIAERVWLSTSDFFLKVHKINAGDKVSDSVVFSERASVDGFPLSVIREGAVKIVVEIGPEKSFRVSDAVCQFRNPLSKSELWLKLKLKELVVMARSTSDLAKSQGQSGRCDKRSCKCAESGKPLACTVFIVRSAAHHLVDNVSPMKTDKEAADKQHCRDQRERDTEGFCISKRHFLHHGFFTHLANTGKRLMSGLRTKLTDRVARFSVERWWRYE